MREEVQRQGRGGDEEPGESDPEDESASSRPGDPVAERRRDDGPRADERDEREGE